MEDHDLDSSDLASYEQIHGSDGVGWRYATAEGRGFAPWRTVREVRPGDGTEGDPGRRRGGAKGMIVPVAVTDHRSGVTPGQRNRCGDARTYIGDSGENDRSARSSCTLSPQSRTLRKWARRPREGDPGDQGERLRTARFRPVRGPSPGSRWANGKFPKYVEWHRTGSARAITSSR